MHFKAKLGWQSHHKISSFRFYWIKLDLKIIHKIFKSPTLLGKQTISLNTLKNPNTALAVFEIPKTETDIDDALRKILQSKRNDEGRYHEDKEEFLKKIHPNLDSKPLRTLVKVARKRGGLFTEEDLKPVNEAEVPAVDNSEIPAASTPATTESELPTTTDENTEEASEEDQDPPSQ